jgi:phosphoribosylformylglycinamidine cyclo-ligase
MRLTPASKVENIKHSLGHELLRVHKNYQPFLAKIPVGMIHGLAHITGGGLIDNLPRVLPETCDAVIETRSWRVPPLFEVLQRMGKVNSTEMYQVFNMGIGMVAIVSEGDVPGMMSILKAKRIGRTELGRGKTKLVF